MWFWGYWRFIQSQQDILNFHPITFSSGARVPTLSYSFSSLLITLDCTGLISKPALSHTNTRMNTVKTCVHVWQLTWWQFIIVKRSGERRTLCVVYFGCKSLTRIARHLRLSYVHALICWAFLKIVVRWFETVMYPQQLSHRFSEASLCNTFCNIKHQNVKLNVLFKVFNAAQQLLMYEVISVYEYDKQITCL